MAEEEIPIGRLFTHVYRDRGDPKDDSPRMRRRLSAYFHDFVSDNGTDIANYLERKLGVRITNTGYGYNWEEFILRSDVDEILDSLTITWRILNYDDNNSSYSRDHAGDFVKVISEIFNEENIAFRMDERGGIHPRIDTAFEGQRIAAVSSLQASRYRASLDSFERGMEALSERPSNGKGAIRGVFGAAEILFRLIAPSAPRLGATEARQHLTPMVDKAYATDTTAKQSGMKMLRSFQEWIDAAHFYRHEQGQEEPTQPPFDLAVLIVSEGIGFVRWLAVLDTAARDAQADK